MTVQITTDRVTGQPHTNSGVYRIEDVVAPVGRYPLTQNAAGQALTMLAPQKSDRIRVSPAVQPSSVQSNWQIMADFPEGVSSGHAVFSLISKGTALNLSGATGLRLTMPAAFPIPASSASGNAPAYSPLLEVTYATVLTAQAVDAIDRNLSLTDGPYPFYLGGDIVSGWLGALLDAVTAAGVRPKTFYRDATGPHIP
jgi:hypothetical protein